MEYCKPIYIENKDLIIEDSTILNFSSKSFIHIKNGNLKINQNLYKIIDGTTQLKAINDYWLGIYVENNNEMTQKSVIKNAIIKDTKNFKYKLYNLMGGINFYKSNIEINNLEINNSYSEDQINFINTNFNINNSIFLILFQIQ